MNWPLKQAMGYPRSQKFWVTYLTLKVQVIIKEFEIVDSLHWSPTLQIWQRVSLNLAVIRTRAVARNIIILGTVGIWSWVLKKEVLTK